MLGKQNHSAWPRGNSGTSKLSLQQMAFPKLSLPERVLWDVLHSPALQPGLLMVLDTLMGPANVSAAHWQSVRPEEGRWEDRSGGTAPREGNPKEALSASEGAQGLQQSLNGSVGWRGKTHAEIIPSASSGCPSLITFQEPPWTPGIPQAADPPQGMFTVLR